LPSLLSSLLRPQLLLPVRVLLRLPEKEVLPLPPLGRTPQTSFHYAEIESLLLLLPLMERKDIPSRLYPRAKASRFPQVTKMTTIRSLLPLQAKADSLFPRLPVMVMENTLLPRLLPARGAFFLLLLPLLHQAREDFHFLLLLRP
jgi:hypothetical protein